MKNVRTLHNGEFSQVEYFRLLVYVKRSSNSLKTFIGAICKLDCIVDVDEHNKPVPCHADIILDNGNVVNAYEIAIPIALMHHLDEYIDYLPCQHLPNSKYYANDRNRVIVSWEEIVSIRVPHGMGKLSTLTEGSRKAESITHVTGRKTPNDKDCLVGPHGRITLKQRRQEMERELEKESEQYSVSGNRADTTVVKEISRIPGKGKKTGRTISLPNISTQKKKECVRDARNISHAEYADICQRLNVGIAECFNGSHI